MTVLTVVQDVSVAVGKARPLMLFGSTQRDMLEMQAVISEAATVILQAFDWQKLIRKQVVTGNGASESFSMPADYQRMLKKGAVWSSRWRWQANHVVDLDTWMEITEPETPVINGVWTIFGDALHFLPVLSGNETIKFYYISNLIAKGPAETPTAKAKFTNDGDTFVLDERILKLCAIYLWKQGKGQDFAAELADFEQAIDQYMVDDKGSQPVISGNTGYQPSSNVWPGRVSG